jgi:ACR3 family arsenite transporter
MAAGVLLGKALPSAVAGLRSVEFSKGSEINLPIAVF